MTRTPLSTSLDAYEVWFVTGSQNLYGEETLQQVAEQSQRVASALDSADEVPVRVVWKPVLTDAGAIRRAMGEANELMQTSRLCIWPPWGITSTPWTWAM